MPHLPDPYEAACREAGPDGLWRTRLPVQARLVLMAILSQLEPGATPPVLRRCSYALLLPPRETRRALRELARASLLTLEPGGLEGESEYVITLHWRALARAFGLSVDKTAAA